VGAPDDLDDVPACAAENAFQFLDDLTVAAHWAVEPLEIAVHDPDEVVEVFAGGEGELAQAFRLVGLAVSNERPHFGFAFPVYQVAGLQVAVEARLIDGHDRPQSHRYGWELPEVGHQIRMR